MIIVVSLPLATSLIVLQYNCIWHYTQILDDVTLMIKHGTNVCMHEMTETHTQYTTSLLSYFSDEKASPEACVHIKGIVLFRRSVEGILGLSVSCGGFSSGLGSDPDSFWAEFFLLEIGIWLVSSWSASASDLFSVSIWEQLDRSSISESTQDLILDLDSVRLWSRLFDGCSRNLLRIPSRKCLTNTYCPTSNWCYSLWLSW